MSILGRYLEWFGEQGTGVQVGSTVGLFALLFVLGLYTAGIAPGIVFVVVLVDHWYRGLDEGDADDGA
ncbi:hypothetical protein [Halorubrum sp. DTA46]|uniref:hypothetical protein n=1 Tax=Halorubrum sp. DTA46 TaxID=3402162 RepID=UPI003AAC4137